MRYLSHGEQRQLEIVLGLASDPKILLLDEPAAGLSSGESAEMTKFLQKLDPNLAILLIEHDMDVVFDVARSHFGAAFRRGSGNRNAEADPRQQASAGNLSGDRLIMAILEVQDIHTYYGDAYVLQGLSLQLEQGQILGLLGRNGVGKTTLVNSIVGFNPPRRGRIIFKGEDITSELLVRDGAQRHGAGAAGPARVSDAERRGEPAGRRAQRRPPRLEPRPRLRAVPAPAGAAQSARQDAVGRRAADAGDRPRADDQSGLPDHGRAVRRAGARSSSRACGRRSAS